MLAGGPGCEASPTRCPTQRALRRALCVARECTRPPPPCFPYRKSPNKVTVVTEAENVRGDFEERLVSRPTQCWLWYWYWLVAAAARGNAVVPVRGAQEQQLAPMLASLVPIEVLIALLGASGCRGMLSWYFSPRTGRLLSVVSVLLRGCAGVSLLLVLVARVLSGGRGEKEWQRRRV